MMRHIADEKRDYESTKELYEKDGEKMEIYSYTFGYEIAEREANQLYGQWRSLSVRTYKNNGELNDECLIGETVNHIDPFYGRPEEKIRFKVGDIVEVCRGGEAELQIIAALPWTPEKVEKRNRRLMKERGQILLQLDAFDDCYLSYSLGIGDTHEHLECITIFSPTKKVSFALKHRLWAKLMEVGLIYGHDIPHSFLMQHANDDKLNEEVLIGLEKMADKGMADFYPYETCTRAMETIKILSFSEKQIQRFINVTDRFIQIYAQKYREQ